MAAFSQNNQKQNKHQEKQLQTLQVMLSETTNIILRLKEENEELLL